MIQSPHCGLLIATGAQSEEAFHIVFHDVAYVFICTWMFVDLVKSLISVLQININVLQTTYYIEIS